jgi:D-glycerate 3-kinase
LGAALDALGHPGPVNLPRFDKGRDDVGEPVNVEGPFDLVLLEGWCVGAPPATGNESSSPVNALEASEDERMRWRTAIDGALADGYAGVWARMDALVFLAVPDLEAVRRWRLQQESERPPALRLDRRAVDRFVAHFERITLRMLERMPDRSDWTVRLNRDHGVDSVELRSPIRSR